MAQLPSVSFVTVKNVKDPVIRYAFKKKVIVVLFPNAFQYNFEKCIYNYYLKVIKKCIKI